MPRTRSSDGSETTILAQIQSPIVFQFFSFLRDPYVTHSTTILRVVLTPSRVLGVLLQLSGLAINGTCSLHDRTAI